MMAFSVAIELSGRIGRATTGSMARSRRTKFGSGGELGVECRTLIWA